MVLRGLILCGIALCMTVAASSSTHSNERTKKKTEDYVKVEVRGKLTDGVVAIGGETTGTTITAKRVTFELELGKKEQLRELVKNLNGKTVVVVGTLERRRGIEIPERWIVTVSDLKPVRRRGEA